MKKRKLEALPPVPLRNAKRKYYMMVAMNAELGGEEHLICDIYRKDGKENEWIMRAAYTRHDWGLWDPGKGKDGWSRKSLRKDTHDWRDSDPVYDECGMINGPGIPKRAGWGNTSLDEESEEIIKGFCKRMEADCNLYMYKDGWHKYLLAIEDAIREEKKEKEEERRREALEDRIRNMPAIPDDFKDWADFKLFRYKEFVYYKRKYSHAECQCSGCGESYTIRTRRPDTYEGMLMRVEPVPENGNVTVCDLCGTMAIYKPEGRMKYVQEETGYAYLLQPFKETGTVLRYFEVRKLWCKGAPSDVRMIELGRVFYEIGRGKNPKTDWQMHDRYSGRDKWNDRNIGGPYNLGMHKGEVYTRNYREWTSWRLKYCGLREYELAMNDKMKPAYYIALAKEYQLEKLVKLGMTKTVTYLIDGNAGYFCKTPNGKVEKILRIRRCRLAMAAEKDDVDFLKVLQLEKWNTDQVTDGDAKGRGEWTVEQIEKAWAMRMTRGDHQVLLEYMSITQLVNRVERYLGRPVVGGGREDKQAKAIADLYRDYFKVRIAQGMGMERSTAIFPKDLRKAHDDAVLMANAREIEKRAAKYEEKYPEIKKQFRKLKAKYGYKDGDLFIRPAKNAREIIEEGKVLHHCVGANGHYIGKHARGESYILFLRKVLEPNSPYITVEVSGNAISQWYGSYDRKTDKAIVDKWLEEWIKHLNGEQEETDGNHEELTAAG